MAIAVIPGSFDPVTLGHMDIISRAASIFEKVVVAVSENSEKKYVFSAEERAALVTRCTRKFSNVEVRICTGLIADFAVGVGASVLVKGVRNATDLSYETQLMWANGLLTSGKIDTMFLPSVGAVSQISSTLVREFAKYGADLSALVPGEILGDVAIRLENVK